MRRVRGPVAYALGDPASARATLIGSILLDGEASAITGVRGAADLALPDSSLVEIGDRTTVRIGAFAKAAGGTTEIALAAGALRFVIRNPAGAKSNYRFSTPTTQVAVRGTVAYLVSGPAGDQVYCVDCAPGDVTVTARGVGDFTIASGQTLNVRRTADRATGATIVANRTINNPAIDQFIGDVSPFGEAAKDGVDVTGSGSGSGI